VTVPLDLRIVAGHPGTTEIAVLAAVLSARAAFAGSTGAPPAARSQWSSRSRLVREPLPRGPGGWRASALPR
jgi:Acyl-CoA carboxylase epsilon subunit